MLARLVAVAVVGASLGLAACGVLSGLDGLSFDGAMGGGGGAGSHPQGGGGGVGRSESCLNGKDDDDNGLVDCEDPACSKFMCTRAVPEGWSGPISFYIGPDTSVACPPGFPMVAFAGGTQVTAPPVGCNPCVCGAEPCDVLTAHLFSETSCANETGTQGLMSGVCAPPPPFAPGIEVDKPFALLGSCSASGGGVAAAPPPAFVDRAVGCAPRATGAGCHHGVCAPRPSGVFAAGLCVYQMGAAAACPQGYGSLRLVSTTFDDQRSCTMCGCGSPDTWCPIDIHTYSDAACTVDAGGIADATCFDPSNVAGLDVKALSPCAPAGGAPQGAVQPAGPVTVCCPQ